MGLKGDWQPLVEREGKGTLGEGPFTYVSRRHVEIRISFAVLKAILRITCHSTRMCEIFLQ